MSLRLLIIGLALVLVCGALPFLMEQASRPQVFTVNSVENTLSWKEGPDVELNKESLRKLNLEVQEMARRELPGPMSPYHIVPLGKRGVEVMYMGAQRPSDELEAKVEAYIQIRGPDLAKTQEKNENVVK